MEGLGEIFSGRSLPIKSDALATMSWDIWCEIQEYYEPKQMRTGDFNWSDVDWNNHSLLGIAGVRSK